MKISIKVFKLSILKNRHKTIGKSFFYEVGRNWLQNWIKSVLNEVEFIDKLLFLSSFLLKWARNWKIKLTRNLSVSWKIVWTIFEIIASLNCVAVTRIFYVFISLYILKKDMTSIQCVHPHTHHFLIVGLPVRINQVASRFRNRKNPRNSRSNSRTDSREVRKSPVKPIDDHPSIANRYWPQWPLIRLHNSFDIRWIFHDLPIDANYYGFLYIVLLHPSH